MAVSSREELKEYALRRLGAPTISVNIADLQIEDRIDEALQYFQEWHFDGTEKIFMKHQLKASVMNIVDSFPAGTFKDGWMITGQTSGAHATIWKQTGVSKIDFYLMKDSSFIIGEDIYVSPTGDITRADGTLTQIVNVPTAIVLGDFEKRYIEVPNTILSILRILPVQMNSAGTYLFDGQYYTMMDVLFNFKGGDLITYSMTKQYLNVLQQMFTGEKNIRYNHLSGQLHVDWDWMRSVKPDIWIIIECYRIMDPSTYPAVWNDQWLKMYVCALLKEQWSQNLGKYQNVQLLGGVTLNAEAMMAQAKEEKKEIEEALRTRFSMPVGFLVG